MTISGFLLQPTLTTGGGGGTGSPTNVYWTEISVLKKFVHDCSYSLFICLVLLWTSVDREFFKTVVSQSLYWYIQTFRTMLNEDWPCCWRFCLVNHQYFLFCFKTYARASQLHLTPMWSNPAHKKPPQGANILTRKEGRNGRKQGKTRKTKRLRRWKKTTKK